MYKQNSQRETSENGYKQYLRSRPGASVDSVRRVKELPLSTLGPHPLFAQYSKPVLDKSSILTQIKNYKPQGVSFSDFEIINPYGKPLKNWIHFYVVLDQFRFHQFLV